MEIFLKTLPFFNGLSEKDFQTLIFACKIKTYPKKSAIYMQGDSAKRFYVVMSGCVKLYQTTKEGNETVLALFDRGESFGEAILIEGASYPHNAETLEETKIIELPADAMRELIAQNSTLAIYLMQSMTSRIERLQLENEHLSVMSTVERVACFIYQQYLARPPHFSGKSAALNLPYNKHLASIRLGMKQETFSRALKTLQTIGVNVWRNRVVIHNPKALEKICCSNCSASPENCPLVKYASSFSSPKTPIIPRGPSPDSHTMSSRLNA